MRKRLASSLRATAKVFRAERITSASLSRAVGVELSARALRPTQPPTGRLHATRSSALPRGDAPSARHAVDRPLARVRPALLEEALATHASCCLTADGERRVRDSQGEPFRLSVEGRPRQRPRGDRLARATARRRGDEPVRRFMQERGKKTLPPDPTSSSGTRRSPDRTEKTI
jgi:hypothetical protein